MIVNVDLPFKALLTASVFFAVVTSPAIAQSQLEAGQTYELTDLDNYNSISMTVLDNKRDREFLRRVGCNSGPWIAKLSQKNVQTTLVEQSSLMSILASLGLNVPVGFAQLKSDLEFKLEELKKKSTSTETSAEMTTGEILVERNWCFNKDVYETYDLRKLRVNADAYTWLGNGRDSSFEITTKDNYDILVVATYTTKCATSCDLKTMLEGAIDRSTHANEDVKSYQKEALDAGELRDASGWIDDGSGTLWLTIKNKRNEYHLPLKYNQFWEILNVFPLIPDEDKVELLQSTGAYP